MTEWLRENSWALAPAFIIALGLVVWAKKRLAGNVEIKPIDAGIALIPFLLWMGTAGILKKVEVPGILSFETATAQVIVDAAAAPIELQVTALPVSDVIGGAKEGVFQIEKLIHKGTEALNFKLGYSGYYGPAIWMYMNQLSKTSSFRYIVIEDNKGALFGVYDASRVLAALNPQDNDELMQRYPLKNYHGTPPVNKVKEWSKFADALRRAQTDKLKIIPGFIADKVVVTSNKKEVLTYMETKGLDWLPVVSDESAGSKLLGVVERSRLTASLILDVANQLEKKQKEAKEK